MLGGMGAIDYAVTIDISLSIFYLGPIGLMTWLAGREWGLLTTAIATILCFGADTAHKDYAAAWMPYWNAGVKFSFFVLISCLLSSLKIADDREKQLARLDSLTKIANRRFFFETLELEVGRSRRYGRPLTLAYIDIDNFRTVNERFGRSVGDQVLQTVANKIKSQIRVTDLVSRLQGDEFALLLPETNYEAAQIVLDRIHDSLVKHFAVQPWPIGISIGAATFLTMPELTDEMMQQVDQLMYSVKNSGKNRLEHTNF